MPAGPIVLTNALIKLATVDLSSDIKMANLDYKAEVPDVTTFGALARKRKGGLKDWNLTITGLQNYSAGRIDATLYPLVGSDVAVEIRPDKDEALGAENPKYTGSGILESYPPLNASVGEVVEVAISIVGNGLLARATA